MLFTRVFPTVASLIAGISLLAADAPKPKADFKGTAEQFVKHAVTDAKAGDALKGKVVELTGVIGSADEHNSLWGVTLPAGKLKPNDIFALFLECELPEGQKEAAWMLARNQRVQVTGEVKSVQKDRVRLTNCAIKELEKNPLQTVKAADMSAAFSRSPQAAEKTYGSAQTPKEWLVEGVVSGTKLAEYNLQVTLEAPGKTGVVAIFPKSSEGKFKAGDALVIKGTCRGVATDIHAVLISADLAKVATGKAAKPAPKK